MCRLPPFQSAGRLSDRRVPDQPEWMVQLLGPRRYRRPRGTANKRETRAAQNLPDAQAPDRARTENYEPSYFAPSFQKGGHATKARRPTRAAALSGIFGVAQTSKRLSVITDALVAMEHAVRHSALSIATIYERVCDFLARRVAARGIIRFSWDVVYGACGLLRLERLPLTAASCALR